MTAAVGLMSIVAAACTSPPAHHALPTVSTTTTSTTAPAVTTTTLPAGNLPWGVVSTDAVGVAAEEATITVPSGRPVVLVRFRQGAVRFDLPFEALLDVDLPTYAPEACPLCARGLPVVKPGSRPLKAI